MSLTFPASPTVGDTYTVGARTWSWSGTIWEMTGTVAVAGSIGTAELAASAVTTAKIAAGAVTAAKLGNDISLTPADGSITQAKLTSGLSGITVTTTANRSAVIPSPFNGQFIFLTDTSELQRWNGSAWVSGVSSPPTEAPTSLALVSATATTATISFAAGAEGGSAITNYQYALSTNSGSSYGSYNALATPDATSPITIPGLTAGTAYYIKLKAVNAQGVSNIESSALSFSTLAAPSAPTSLSATGSYLAATISFTAGAEGGSAITNYEYALSTNGGSTYGSFTALSPADTTTPIEITGLANSTTYSIKIRAVSTVGAGVESSAVSVTTNQNVQVGYLMVAGGGGGGRSPNVGGGGGGAGGVAVHTNYSISIGTNYALSIGAGGAAYSGYDGGGNNGSSSSGFGNTLNGGGTSGYYNRNTGYIASTSGGSGGGGAHAYNTGGASVPGTVAAGATFYGNAGGNGGSINGVSGHPGGGGGGAGAVGATVNTPSPFAGAGGVGISNSLTGSAVFVGGGGGGSATEGGQVGGNGGGGAGGQGSSYAGTAGTVNTGGGGGGAGPVGYDVGAANPSGAGGSGLIVIQYPAARTITVGAGLTASHTNTAITVGGVSMKYTRITAGTGNVSWA